MILHNSNVFLSFRHRIYLKSGSLETGLTLDIKLESPFVIPFVRDKKSV